MTKAFSIKKMAGLSAAACMLFASGAQAAITDVEGQAGGGLVPWALLSSGPTIALSHLTTPDLNVNTIGINTSFSNMVEVSYGRAMLNDGGGVGSAALAGQNTDAVDNLGVKVKLNDMSDTMPQFAVGLVYKNTSGPLMDFLNTNLGIKKTGTDVYGAVSKIVNIGGKNVLLNGVLRASKANEMGLLGFEGGTTAGAKTSYSIKPEISAELFASSNVIFGAEYRAQPSNGVTATDPVIHQNSAYDFNVVYVASKNITLTAAYVSLGQVAPAVNGSNRQDGMFVQAQVNF
jgi:Protein of unknown function (DUF3034)